MTPSVFSFQLEHADGPARAGVIRTPHGSAPTPLFMPVATQATVKGLTPEEVAGAGGQVVLSNAYHLYLRPGVGTVNSLGGLHGFMRWPGPILTDSGGFQAFSMGSLRKVNDEGIRFRSHLDGSEHHFTPELATMNQVGLGADIIMCFDQCIAYGATEDEVRRAMERTHRWAAECHRIHRESGAWPGQALFGIVQGGTFPQLRDESSEAITSIPFDGYAVGGLAVGEDKEQLYGFTAQVTGHLPTDKPRYLMGVGSPEDLVEGVWRGIDMFDCALPTRVARNGAMFTPDGRIDIKKKAIFREERAGGRGMRLLRLRQLLRRLHPPPVPRPRNPGVAPGLGPQPALRAAADGADTRGDTGRPFRQLPPPVPRPLPTHQRSGPPRTQAALAARAGVNSGSSVSPARIRFCQRLQDVQQERHLVEPLSDVIGAQESLAGIIISVQFIGGAPQVSQPDIP